MASSHSPLLMSAALPINSNFRLGRQRYHHEVVNMTSIHLSSHESCGLPSKIACGMDVVSVGIVRVSRDLASKISDDVS